MVIGMYKKFFLIKNRSSVVSALLSDHPDSVENFKSL